MAYQWVGIDHISRFALGAAIAHEDQQLGTRTGAFDINDFNAYLQGKPDPSGSTIPQQFVKNTFLWPDQDGFRKALEAGLAKEFALTLPPKRILELYLNYAQFGPKLYGICAASWYYFKHAPYEMTEHEAAELMGVLPLPNRIRRMEGGGIVLDKETDSLVWEYVNGAANYWVPKQLEGLGGWEKAVATVGITDKASDHASTRYLPDGWSTMPESLKTVSGPQAVG